MNAFSLIEASCFVGIATQLHSRTHIYVPLIKHYGKWSVYYISRDRSRILYFVIFERVWKCSLDLLNLHIDFKIVYLALLTILQFLFHWRNIENLHHFYCYFHGKCTEDRHSLVLLVWTFTVRIINATSTESNHTYFLRVPIKKKKDVPPRELFFPMCD